MDHMKKLREKKGMHKMRPMEQKAKMGVMEDLQKMAHDAMGGKLRGMKKVSVMSDSEEGLEHGLDKAHDVLKHLPPGLDDSHHDHENAALTENEEDGNDGMDSFPDADDAHQLEADPHHQHMKDEEAEGEHAQRLAMGGEVGDEDHDSDNSSDEASELPSYDDMDRGEMSAHLEALVKAMKSKGLA
jgi:hypothetical protein